jgi:hypothetical protein
MLMKIASEYDGPRAGIACEPASIDFLARRPQPRDPNAPPPPGLELSTSLTSNIYFLRLCLLPDFDPVHNFSVARMRLCYANCQVMLCFSGHGSRQDD